MSVVFSFIWLTVFHAPSWHAIVAVVNRAAHPLTARQDRPQAGTGP
ncbi:hypothetical protein [Komagataeibacter medellinensis]|nr:hypothetical protein [Komagataeibacter medellinensis]